MRLLPTSIEMSKSQMQFLEEVLRAQENARVDIRFGYTTVISASFTYFRRSTPRESWASQSVTVTAEWKGGKFYGGSTRYAGGFMCRERTLGSCIGEVRSVARRREEHRRASERAAARAAKRAGTAA